MAIKKIIEIDVEAVQAMGGLDALQNSLAETEKSSVSLKAELRKLKEQLAQLPEGSEEYNKVAKQAGEVSDKLGDINTRIKNLGSDTKNIDAVVQGTQALSGAFTVASSASALLGEENKDLQETMLKVESAIGLTVGIQSIANALQKESALAIGLSTVATKIQTGAQIVYATVVGTTTGALKALRVALLSTGVGALVVALGFLVAKMSESTEATEDQDKALADLTETQKRFNESLKSEIDGIQNSTQLRVLRAKIAGKSEKELREIEKQGESDRATAIDNEIKRIDKELQNRKLSNAEFKLLQEERNKLGDEAIKLSQDRDVKQLEFELSLADKRRDAQAKSRDEANAESKRLSDERKAREKKELEERLAFENAKGRQAEEAFDKILQREAEAKEANRIAGLTELEQTQQKYDALIEQARLANVSTVELEIEKANAINDINLKAQETEYANKKAADEKKAADDAIVAANKEAMLQSNISNLETILSIGGKRFAKVQKALAIAEIVRDTIRAVNAATGNEIKVPAFIGTIPNPVKPASLVSTALGIGAAVAKGAASIAAITSDSKSVGGGSKSNLGGGGTGGSSSAPQFNLVGQSSTNQLTATIAGQQNRPVQTFVVGSQVTSQQALDRNAQANSVFG